MLEHVRINASVARVRSSLDIPRKTDNQLRTSAESGDEDEASLIDVDGEYGDGDDGEGEEHEDDEEEEDDDDDGTTSCSRGLLK